MILVIREYLSMLKESGQFDALFPDLLLAMNLVSVSKPQIGVRQSGVDIAAVGNDESGNQALWLFVLKRGDIGRRDWDNSEPQSIRPSLEEIKDVYLNSHVSPEHQGLPVRIVVVTTGDFRQEIEQNKAGYSSANTVPGRSYEFWNGDHVASLIAQHLLNEYALPSEARSQLRRALALLGQPDYTLDHFYALIRDMLTWHADLDAKRAAKSEKECLTALRTTSLALGILSRWSAQEGNLRHAVLACERSLLWGWDAIQRNGSKKNKKLLQGYARLIDIYLATSTEYFNKVQSHLHTKDAIARYYPESALLTERVFEEIGLVATIGLVHLLSAVGRKDEERIKGAGFIAETLKALLNSHECSGSPCYDGNVVDISLALLFFMFSEKEEHAKSWIPVLASRITYGFRIGKWFPISTDAFDDLLALEIDRSDEDVKKLMETSWMVPTIAQWAAALKEDDMYAHLVELREDACKSTCFQLWYPDEKTDGLLFRGPAHFETGMAEAPIDLPATAQEMREQMTRVREESPVKSIIQSSATEAGLPWLDFIANRHFRTPVDPMYWQRLPELLASTLGPELPTSNAPNVASGGTPIGEK